jgi:hypothetical protein
MIVTCADELGIAKTDSNDTRNTVTDLRMREV